MKVSFRTDASLDIGTGHVMRCLTLAEALSERGALCRFVCRDHPGNLIELIRQRGFEVLALPFDGNWTGIDVTNPVHAVWLGADWVTDAEQTKVGAGETAVDWLIVDHYALDARWESAMHAVAERIMVIDDIADRPHDCDLLLDQNLGRRTEDYGHLVPDGCTILAGPQYALLRPEFATLRPYSLARRAAPRLKRLLITMGGVDKEDATGEVLDALRACSLPADCQIGVVMGPHAPWLARARERAASMPWPTEVLVNACDMAKLMADSDLAIGAAGSTSWERCCLGLPSIIVVLAANQQPVAQGLEVAGAAIMVRLPTLKTDIERILTDMLASSALLTQMSADAAEVTSGAGIAELSRALTNEQR
jgi:UDP-2,4-diacetamido-2,4,6-trideoxy-beta-L-altropyranose hydrolase